MMISGGLSLEKPPYLWLSHLALWVLKSYVAEYSKIQAPVLSFFSIRDGSDYLSSDYMTEEQKAQVTDYFCTTLASHVRKDIEQFRSYVPHAKVVEIPGGHHYCFIKQEELVYDEMRKFLLEG